MKKLVLLLGFFAIISQGSSQDVKNVLKNGDAPSVNNGIVIPPDKLKEVYYDTVNYCTYNKTDFWLTRSCGFKYKMALYNRDVRLVGEVKVMAKEPAKHLAFELIMLLILAVYNSSHIFLIKIRNYQREDLVGDVYDSDTSRLWLGRIVVMVIFGLLPWYIWITAFISEFIFICFYYFKKECEKHNNMYLTFQVISFILTLLYIGVITFNPLCPIYTVLVCSFVCVLQADRKQQVDRRSKNIKRRRPKNDYGDPGSPASYLY